MNRVVFSSASVEWPTPEAVYSRLDEEFSFDFDPCPIGGEEDGLAALLTPWTGKRVFCNPPYGPKLGKWLERAQDAKAAVFLLPAKTDTRWFHEMVSPQSEGDPVHQGTAEIRRGETQCTLPQHGCNF